jgi:hypothetical protein
MIIMASAFVLGFISVYCAAGCYDGCGDQIYINGVPAWCYDGGSSVAGFYCAPGMGPFSDSACQHPINSVRLGTSALKSPPPPSHMVNEHRAVKNDDTPGWMNNLDVGLIHVHGV